MKNLPDFKIKYCDELIETNYRHIVLEEGNILARQEAVASLPENGEKAKRIEENEAEIELIQEKIFGFHQNIKTLEKLKQQYEKEKSPAHE